MQILLQLSDYTDGGLLRAALTDLAEAVGGQAVFGLLGGAAILLTFYVASNGGLATPATLTALTGGLLVAALPAGYQSMAQVVIFLGLVAAIWSVFNRMVTPG